MGGRRIKANVFVEDDDAQDKDEEHASDGQLEGGEEGKEWRVRERSREWRRRRRRRRKGRDGR